MAPTLLEFLKAESQKAYQNFKKQIVGLSEEQAFRYAHPHWPNHPWGIGQNGSIAGIVYHVAAWKECLLPALSSRQGFSPAQVADKLPPLYSSWSTISTWYERVGQEWCSQLSAVQEPELDSLCAFPEEEAIPLYKLIKEIMLHDVQHASQIEYLRQRILAEDTTQPGD